MLGRPGCDCEAPALLLGEVVLCEGCELVEPVVLCEPIELELPWDDCEPVDDVEGVDCEPMEPELAPGVCDVLGAVPAWPAEDDPAGYCTA